MAVIAPGGTPRKRSTRPPARRAPQIETRYVVPALDKGLDVLELLAREAGGLSLNEIARCARPHVERAVSNGGRACAARIHRAARRRPLYVDAQAVRAGASTQADQVADRCRGAADAGARASGAAVVPSDGFSRGPRDGRRRGRQPGALCVRNEGRARSSALPILRRATCCLRFRTTAGVAQCSRRTRRSRASSTSIPLSSRKSFDDVAGKGYAEVQSRQTRGVTNIAFPISGPTGRAVAVLNIPYIERIDKKVTPSIEAVKEMLRESAARLSLLMGYVADAETSKVVKRSAGGHSDGG